MKEIGGFLELELPKYNEYHNGYLMKLNNGRNSIKYAMNANKYKKYIYHIIHVIVFRKI